MENDLFQKRYHGRTIIKSLKKKTEKLSKFSFSVQQLKLFFFFFRLQETLRKFLSELV